MAVAVYHCFARSGGTLVNRLLGSTPGVYVLSEVSPDWSARDPVEQAVEWLGLAAPTEADGLRHLDFGSLVSELGRRAEGRGARLVIRDFVTPAFLRGAFADSVASGQLTTWAALAQADTAGEEVAVIRRAASIYASIVRSFPHLSRLSVDEFAVAYHSYASAVAGLPLVQFELLTTAPAETLARLCRLLGCPFDAAALQNFASYTACTGDTDLVSPSRGSGMSAVAPLDESTGDQAYRAALGHPLCQAADELLGYETASSPAEPPTAVGAYAAELACTRALHATAVREWHRADSAAVTARMEAERLTSVASDQAAEIERLTSIASDQAAEIERLTGMVSARMAEVEALQTRVEAARAETATTKARMDRAAGELARAERIAADRRRAIEEILAETGGAAAYPLS